MCQMVWKIVKYQGKIREKSGNFEVDDKQQPCLCLFSNWQKQDACCTFLVSSSVLGAQSSVVFLHLALFCDKALTGETPYAEFLLFFFAFKVLISNFVWMYGNILYIWKYILKLIGYFKFTNMLAYFNISQTWFGMN